MFKGLNSGSADSIILSSRRARACRRGLTTKVDELRRRAIMTTSLKPRGINGSIWIVICGSVWLGCI